MKPKLQISILEDLESRVVEERQIEIEFKAEYDIFMKRELAYKSNKTKAYALFWERCTKGMENKIKARSEFESKIENNPIQLLKAIKEHALNYQEHRYDMSILLDSIKTLLGTKQQESESLQDYTKRLRVSRDHIGGPIIFNKIVESMDGYDKKVLDKTTRYKNKAFERILGYLYLDNADHSKYGSILTGLNTQESLGNEQYHKALSRKIQVPITQQHFDFLFDHPSWWSSKKSK